MHRGSQTNQPTNQPEKDIKTKQKIKMPEQTNTSWLGAKMIGVSVHVILMNSVKVCEWRHTQHKHGNSAPYIYWHPSVDTTINGTLCERILLFFVWLMHLFYLVYLVEHMNLLKLSQACLLWLAATFPGLRQIFFSALLWDYFSENNQGLNMELFTSKVDCSDFQSTKCNYPPCFSVGRGDYDRILGSYPTVSLLLMESFLIQWLLLSMEWG